MRVPSGLRPGAGRRAGKARGDAPFGLSPREHEKALLAAEERSNQ
jgi:hypothetical protein